MDRTKVMPRGSENIGETIGIAAEEAERFKTAWAKTLVAIEVEIDRMDSFGSDKGTYPYSFISSDFAALKCRTERVMVNFRGIYKKLCAALIVAQHTKINNVFLEGDDKAKGVGNYE